MNPNIFIKIYTKSKKLLICNKMKNLVMKIAASKIEIINQKIIKYLVVKFMNQLLKTQKI